MNLKEIVKTPDVKTFAFQNDPDMGIEVVDPDDDDAEILFELTLAYVSPRDYRAMLSEGISRRATTKSGIKALQINEEKARGIICKRLVKGWRMNIAAAHALELTADMAGIDPKTEIEFTEENLAVMSTKSSLSSVVNDVMTDHEKWFDAPTEDGDDDVTEDSSGNSGSGPSGSMDE